MASLVQYGEYGAIEKYCTTTNWYNIIKFISEAYTQKINTTVDKIIITDGELVVKEQYICSVQDRTNHY